jgi:hypothetical protein
MTMIVGFKLIATKTGAVVQQWGGNYGSCPDQPNPIFLPNGNHLHGAIIGEDYDGYKLVSWEMEKPLPVPADVNAERDRRISAGFAFEGSDFQSRLVDQDNIWENASIALAAIMAGAKAGNYKWKGDEEFVWIAADNSSVKMDAQTFVRFAQALSQWKSSLVLAARKIKDLGQIPADYSADKYWPKPSQTIRKDKLK